VADGEQVRAVDVRPLDQWHQCFDAADNRIADLRLAEACDQALAGAREVYNLAADMGGIGFIESHQAQCMLSVLINSHLLQAALRHGVERYFFASSACVYPVALQSSDQTAGLRESDVLPADPEGGYGWEKLFGERMCLNFMRDYGIEARIARFHNVYGTHGEWRGGREKAPAAICRKVAEAARSESGEIEVWGDGGQTRSFLFAGECVEGTRRLMASNVREPLNLGSSELVTIDQLIDAVAAAAGIDVARRYDLTAPQGVRGRSSDNTLIRDRLGWEPSSSLADGIAPTYAWVREQVAAEAALR
jgi:nucleoside-diphosphate-sugar epimerase